MATILQLSERTYLNLDAVTVLRYEDSEWLVFFHDHAHAYRLSVEETTVLAHYLHNHTNCVSYQAVRRQQPLKEPS